MTVKELLDAKRSGRELAASDIGALISDYAADKVPDYQMAAFAMAVCCRGMTDAETLALTRAMLHSGATLDWPGFPPTADKHSTGGVGDKLSLVIQPLAAACGLAVPSLVGRGLGITGGTADKLASIPGYNVSPSLSEIQAIVKRTSVAMAMQTEELCPADRRLYALRDVTGTVPSIPLIVSSILSKKLAEGVGTLVFDVKCGEGAFMATREEALALARALVKGAQGAGRKAGYMVTAMDEPLGRAVGNALEVEEALSVLGGADVPGVKELSIEFAAMMVSLALSIPLAEAQNRCRKHLSDASALKRFEEMVRSHGGDLQAFRARPAVPFLEVSAPQSGYVKHISARKIGLAALSLGAGRERLTDEIDYSAGVKLFAEAGKYVKAGETIAKVYGLRCRTQLPAVAAAVAAAFEFSASPPPPAALILDKG